MHACAKAQQLLKRGRNNLQRIKKGPCVEDHFLLAINAYGCIIWHKLEL